MLAGDNLEFKLQQTEASVMTVDLCFVMDTTGSMSPWVEACKAKVQDILTRLPARIAEKHPHVKTKIRFAFVAYRDICDGPQQFTCLPFSESLSEVQAFVSPCIMQVSPLTCIHMH